ncbi:MAG: VanZ family protein [Myxococcota bacterium]
MTPQARLRASGPWLAATVAYAGLIVWLSSTPQRIPELLEVIPAVDKVIHTGEYGLFALLVAQTLARLWPELDGLPRFLLALTTAGCFGISDEVHQAWVPGRSASVYDALADLLGAALALAGRMLWVQESPPANLAHFQGSPENRRP